MQNFAVVASVIVGVYMISEGNLTQGGLIASIILSRRVLGPMSKVANLATRYHKAKTALQALNKVMSSPQERPYDKKFLHRSTLQGKIEMKNVSFSYPGQLHDALKNITLKIEPGEHVAIIGPTGSGKTTLGKLILGLYEAKKGMVLMDDTDLKQIDLAELRQFIGYVPQDINLFSGSVRDNIVLGTHDISDNVILESAEAAGVTEFVNINPLGYDMQVGEQGRELSGGQRQSVAIARSLILDPAIYLFDEPSSSMDNKTESRLIQKLSSAVEGKTLVLITHRSSVLKLVDRIVVIDRGKIVADGPKSQVLKTLESDKLPLQ
jgi:ATP-binding cassette subfamily C protein LapB